MFRLSLVSAIALLSIPSVYASVVSTSVFPNSACAGSSNLKGLVGVGRVTLANGQVETHCGCPSDNLPDFTACELSAHGESVCNSVLDLDTGSFAASCGVVSCSGSDCPTTVVNSVVVDQDDCYNSEKGSIGIVTIDGESKCGCASDSNPEDFSACPSPVNGRATCVSVDSDFLGMAYSHNEKVECGVACDDDHFLTPGGSCTKLAKREYNSHSASHGPSHTGTAGPSGTPTHVPHHPHNAHTTTYGPGGPASSATTTSYSYKHHQPSHVNSGDHQPSSRPSFHDRTSSSAVHHASSRPIKAGPSSSPSHGGGSHSGGHSSGGHSSHGSHGSNGGNGGSPGGNGGHGNGGSHGGNFHHSSMGQHRPTSRPSWHDQPSTTDNGGSQPHPTTAPGGGNGGNGGNGSHSSGASSHAGPSATRGPSASQAVRRAQEYVFSDVCAQDERTCPSGSFGDFSCVRLDDVVECGGCNTQGTAQNCLEIVGASSTVCLKGGCSVRSCQTGYVQTSDSTCECIE